jgi:hypothetical protein
LPNISVLRLRLAIAFGGSQEYADGRSRIKKEIQD